MCVRVCVCLCVCVCVCIHCACDRLESTTFQVVCSDGEKGVSG